MLRNVVLLLFGFAAALGCQSKGTPAPTQPPANTAPAVDAFRAAETRRKATAAEMTKADPAALTTRMTDDSKRGVEPFNSAAYREAVRRGGAMVPALTAGIGGRVDRTVLIPLMALRAIDRGAYEKLPADQRAAVLVDALKKAPAYNAWGTPSTRWEDPAQAIIELGKVADPLLVPLLDDGRRALLWGSEDAVESERYKYRVRDYALALLSAIRGNRSPLPADPSARDRMIEDLRGRAPGPPR